MSLYNTKKGFTLIELLVVIALVGIMAAVAILVINPTALQNKAKDGVIKSQLDKIGLAVSGVYSSSETLAYPTCASLISFLQGAGACSGNTFAMTVGSLGSVTFTYVPNGSTNACVSAPAYAGGADWRWCGSNGTITQGGTCGAGC